MEYFQESSNKCNRSFRECKTPDNFCPGNSTTNQIYYSIFIKTDIRKKSLKKCLGSHIYLNTYLYQKFVMFSKELPVAVGSDHAGFGYKQVIISFLEEKGTICQDFGTYSSDSADYPDFAHPVSKAVESGKAAFGILICGSGNGVAMSANKHQGIRAALCWNGELADLARKHNNANIICIPARFVSAETALALVEIFMHSAFEGGRHERRVKKIAC